MMRTMNIINIKRLKYGPVRRRAKEEPLKLSTIVFVFLY